MKNGINYLGITKPERRKPDTFFTTRFLKGSRLRKYLAFFLMGLPSPREIVISISRNGLLKSCAMFIMERSEIRKKQHAFEKSVHFECRMVFFYMIWEKSRL